MPRYFLDTSALAKFYREEEGSAEVKLLFDAIDNQFVISSLTTVEFQSVFAQKVRAGELSLDDYQIVRRKFGSELRQKRLIVRNLLRRHQRDAERLIAARGPEHRLRTLDALQLAIAIDLRKLDVTDFFVVADRDLAQVAELEGLAVLVPAAK